MRIDEFSALPDGTISSTDQTRFMTLGFDITISTIVSQFNYIITQTMSKYNLFTDSAKKYNQLTGSAKKYNQFTGTMKG